ncbi:MAG: signal peptidase I [Dethiobacter sp.]|jgi:signal peptidase I|nr:signal peptidase I [Dethiobacter sp.]
MTNSREVREWVRSIAVAVVLALVIRFFLFEVFVVEGRSMYPTLEEHERLVVNKFIYRFEEPQPGDIVVFEHEPRRDFIKRVLGVGGDSIEIRDGVVYRNRTAVNEPYLLDRMDYQLAYGPVEVPPGYLFLLGDFRRNSMDSRDPRVGFVSVERIKGRAFLIFWPLSEIRVLSDKVAEQ